MRGGIGGGDLAEEPRAWVVHEEPEEGVPLRGDLHRVSAHGVGPAAPLEDTAREYVSLRAVYGRGRAVGVHGGVGLTDYRRCPW